ncbi:MAG: plasmid stabilization protein [Lentisphaerae bacterium RIFOXYB12_FULL_65_16]|nr:MAG: plasmid stabilization protein [Lentisphaerae bacterium RIFOXYA12_64_32]OGV93791.1 MAG: plasmid stabilization protein [Lentisphaerae bacterium RIFOXYB12_FULL_65_16]
MAELIWAEPAIQDLDAVADYIALDNPDAARRYVRKVFAEVSRLKVFPEMGQVPAELEDLPQYRHLVIGPCRLFYRVSAGNVFVLHVTRCERLFRRQVLLDRDEAP